MFNVVWAIRYKLSFTQIFWISFHLDLEWAIEGCLWKSQRKYTVRHRTSHCNVVWCTAVRSSSWNIIFQVSLYHTIQWVTRMKIAAQIYSAPQDFALQCNVIHCSALVILGQQISSLIIQWLLWVTRGSLVYYTKRGKLYWIIIGKS